MRDRLLAARGDGRTQRGSMCITKLFYRLRCRPFSKKKDCEWPESTKLQKCAREFDPKLKKPTQRKLQVSWGQVREERFTKGRTLLPVSCFSSLNSRTA